MTNPRVRQWAWMLLRVAVCAAAVLYVGSRTELHDKVWLVGREEPVRLVRLEAGTAQIIDDGKALAVPADRLETDENGEPRVGWGLASLASRSDKPLFLLAVLVFGVQPLLQVARFRWMLGLQGIHVTWRNAAAICFMGNFYSYVIPAGTTGGDIVRAGYLMRHHINRHGTLVAIALDRITGMAGMFALAGLVGLLSPIEHPTARYAAHASLVILACMVVGFVAVTGWQWVIRLLGRLPMGSHLQQLYEAASLGRRRWPMLLAAVGVTMLLQAGAMASFSIAAVALGMEPLWQQYFVCLPLALVVAAIPVSPMGIGTQEAAMIVLLAGQAGSVSQVVGLAFAMRIIGLVWALPGGIIPLFQRTASATDAPAATPPADAPDVTAR